MKKRSLALLFLSAGFFLTACQALEQEKTLPVDLSAEQRLELENKAQNLEQELENLKKSPVLKDLPQAPEGNESKNPDLATEEGAKNENSEKESNEPEMTETKQPEVENVESNENTTNEISEQDVKEDATPPIDRAEKEIALTLELANTYQALGKVGRAIKLYENYLAEGNVSYPALNNVGRLHEDLGQYDQAIVYYQRLIDEYRDQDYFRDLTEAYLALGDFEKAEYNYNQWRVTKNNRDMDIERRLEKLKQTQLDAPQN